jgi:phosphoglucosamine mutase
MMNKKTKLFGTDGIRGKANTYPMDPATVMKIGKAIGLYFKKKDKKTRVLIGKDTRKSGYLLEQALSSGLCSVGANTYLLGPLPTPGVAYLTRGMRADVGIMISASHNPFYDNGIKIFSADGFKLSHDSEEELERLIFSDELAENPIAGNDIGICKRIDDAMGQYAVFLKEQFPKHLSLEGLRIVVDCANGAAYRLAPKVFEELGAEIFVIGNNPDGININEQCGALHPKALAEKVLLYKANIGIALDGDADRLITVDEKGSILDGDEILAICSHFFMERNRLKDKTLVTTLMSNGALDEVMKKMGGKLIRTQVGDRNVCKLMREKNYSLGGEQSGHIICADKATTGDGVLASLLLLEALLEKKQTLSEARKIICKNPQVIQSFSVSQKIPLENLPKLSQGIKDVEEKLSPSGRVLFRYSGTENKARIMLEGKNEADLKEYARTLKETAEESIFNYKEIGSSEQILQEKKN